jgi:hypothetical protein
MNQTSTNEAFALGDLTSAIVDPWAWWRAALKDPKEIGRSLPVHEGEPNTGFYRVRYAKDKAFEPVAIWKEDGQWLAYRSGREANAADIWTSVCRHPVEYQAYLDALEGKGWPDDDAVVAKQVQPPEPTIGDNSGEVDEAEKLKDQIEAAVKGVDAYASIKDDETAAKAQSLRNRLNELSGDADKKRDALKRPHLDAGAAIDKKWMPLVKSAKAGADKVRSAMDAWETEKLRQQRAREAAEAEALRLEQESAQAAAPASEDPQIDLAPAPQTVAAPTQIRASYGKAASVSAKIVVDQVTDWPALAVYMSNHKECQDLLRQLAQRAIDAGHKTIPGITTTEIAKVK